MMVRCGGAFLPFPFDVLFFVPLFFFFGGGGGGILIPSCVIGCADVDHHRRQSATISIRMGDDIPSVF